MQPYGGVKAQTWEKTTLSELTSSDIFVIVDLTSKTAMQNDGGTSSTATATAVTISDDGTQITGTVADNLKWNIATDDYTDSDGNTTSAYVFYPNGETAKWLYSTTTGNKSMLVGTGDNKHYVEHSTSTSNGDTYDYTGLKNLELSYCVGTYNSSSWRAYSNVNKNIGSTSMAYFKYNASGTAKTQTTLTFSKSSVEVNKSSSAQTITDNTATLADADGKSIDNASITYSSSSETITVANDGTVTIPANTDYGTTATITAKYEGDDSYYSSEASYTVTVVYTAGDGVVGDVLTYENMSISGTSYADYTYTASSGTGITYAGTVAGGNSSIQMKSADSSSGLYTTSLYGKLVAIVAEFNTNTISGRTLDVYGKSTPYSAASELYSDDTKDTKIGSLTYTTGATYAVLEVSDKYNYVGIRSNSGALYLDKVTFYWQKTNDVAVTIDASGLSSFSATTAMSIPTGITAYQATNISGTTVTLTSLSGSVIPANTGVVIKGTASANVTFEETTESNSDDSFTDNTLIAASAEGCPTSFTNNTEYYALNSGSWYLIDSAVESVPANKAILYIKGGVSNAPLVMTFADDLTNGSGSETTGISNVTTKTQPTDGVYYNLQGMRVANPTSGMYIVNGKKVIIK